MNKSISTVVVLIVVGVIAVIVLSSQIFVTLEPGERGVIFRKFSGGLDKEHIYGEGFHVIAPWNTMHVYDTREQQVDEPLDILDKNALSMNIDVTIRFFPIPERIGNLHATFGQRYKDVLIIPEVRSAVRKVMGRYNAEEIFSTKRKEVEDAIFNETKAALETKRNNIMMSALLIRSIKLPDKIKQAIESKLQQEQEALAYQYKLEKEKSEAERKKIAAEGEAVANNIINNSITDKLLKMKGIDATLELAKSNNSKVVVVGGGGSGLPIILGNEK